MRASFPTGGHGDHFVPSAQRHVNAVALAFSLLLETVRVLGVLNTSVRSEIRNQAGT
jgi:hypothetical protein